MDSSRGASRLVPGPPGTLRLFCFPHAGATSFVYQSWAPILPPEVELWGVHLPGRGQRIGEPPIRSLDALTQSVIATLPVDGAFALLGHSVGALVSFEVGRRLHQEKGLTPRHLFVSAYPAPHLPRRQAPVHTAPDGELLHRLARYDGVPRELLDNAEFMALLLPTLRADFELVETYVHRRHDRLPCAITSYGATDDEEATCDELQAWQHHTAGAFELQMVDGDHLFPFQSRRYLALLSEALATIIRGARSQQGRSGARSYINE